MDSVEMSRFPSLSITLDEIKYFYEHEWRLRQNLETKAGVLLAFSGTIASITSLFGGEISRWHMAFYLMLSLSMIGCLVVLVPSSYSIPHKEFDEYFQYAKMEIDEARDQFLLDYIGAAKDIEAGNGRNAWILMASFALAFLAILILMISKAV